MPFPNIPLVRILNGCELSPFERGLANLHSYPLSQAQLEIERKGSINL